jgi:hypothetical protein
MKIKMLRNVLVDGQHCAVGEVVEVADNLGAVLVRMGRAEAVGGQESAEEGPGARGQGPGEEAVETATRPAGRKK